MPPPKKKSKGDPAAKAAKLKEMEEKRLAMEAERKRQEQEMAALLAQQEALKSQLESGEIEDSDEEGEVDEEEGEINTDMESTAAKSQTETEPESVKEIKDDKSLESGECATTESGSIADGPVPVPGKPFIAKPDAAAPATPVIESAKPAIAQPSTPQSTVTESSSKKGDPAPNRNNLAMHDPKFEQFGNKLFGNLYKERETKFFIVKSANAENVELAMEKKTWITSKVNEIRFNEAWTQHTNVLIFFSVQGSGGFQGCARMSGKSNKNDARLPWTIPPNMDTNLLSDQFQLDWISQQEMKFDHFSHLRNTWNRNKLVKVARDGQELNWKSGCALGMLFPVDGSCDYDDLVLKIKKRRSEIGPRQPPTASSRSSRRRKNMNKQGKVAKGVNPAGFKRPHPKAGNQQRQAYKRRKMDETRGSGANTAPLGNQQAISGGITSLFNL